MRLTPSKNAEQIGVQYLQHEFRKMFPGAGPAVWDRIDREVARMPRIQGEASFWNLLAAVAEDWKLKAIYRILSDTQFRWVWQKVPVERLVLTGMSPIIDRYTIRKFSRDPLQFHAAWKKDAKMRKAILRTGFAAHPERDHFPIFLWEAPDGFRVFDGMRRTLRALIQNKKSIDAWVGISVRRNGKPLVSGGFAYVLSQVYAHASRKDPKLDAALIRIGAAISKDYRNGREVMTKRIAGWAHDKELKALFLRMGRSK